MVNGTALRNLHLFDRRARLRLEAKAESLRLHETLAGLGNAGIGMLGEAFDVLTLLWPEKAVAFRMRVIENRPEDDVADHLGVGAHTVRSWLEERLPELCDLYIEDWYLAIVALLYRAEVSGGRRGLVSCFYPEQGSALEGLGVLFHHAVFRGLLAGLFDDHVLKCAGIDHDPRKAVGLGLPWFRQRAKVRVPGALDFADPPGSRMVGLIRLVELHERGEARTAMAALIAYLSTYHPDLWSRALDILADGMDEDRSDRLIDLTERASWKARYAVAGIAGVLLSQADRKRMGSAMTDAGIGSAELLADIRICVRAATSAR